VARIGCRFFPKKSRQGAMHCCSIKTGVQGCFGGLSEEGAWFEVFSVEKAVCPFRRSETRLCAEFAPFRHPGLDLCPKALAVTFCRRTAAPAVCRAR
jgi:hypothetical protein